MKQHHEEKKHHSQHGCRRPRQHFVQNAGSGGNKCRPNKVRPKQPPGHKRGHQSRHETAIHEVLDPENYQGNGDEDSPKHLALFHIWGPDAAFILGAQCSAVYMSWAAIWHPITLPRGSPRLRDCVR